MTNLQKELFKLRDEKYAEFQKGIVPDINNDKIIGVRVPLLRSFAKEFCKSKECSAFLRELPHKYYDENMLHSILISYIKDFDECIDIIQRFLPYVDNWAVCDTIKSKTFIKRREDLLEYIKMWLNSKMTFTVRFGINILMDYYLDEAFKPEYLQLVSDVKSEEYYVNMCIAWYFATALAKQWEATIPYVENEKMDAWTHNKTIQKAIESYRITDEQKKYLRTLKIKKA